MFTFLLKDSSITNVKFESEIEYDYPVIPMMFIPFVENGFKHSRIENIQEGWIRIHLKSDADKIIFSIENSLPRSASTKDTIGGIGIENVKKRTHLIYPACRHLEIRKDNNTYFVKLEIIP